MALNDKLITYGNLSTFYNNLKSHDLSELATQDAVEQAIQDEADRVDEALEPITEKLDGIEDGAQENVIESVKVNGTALTPDANKAVDVTVPTNLTDLTNDGNFVQDASYVHTDNNYTTTEKNKLAGIAEGAEVNVQADWNVSDSSSDAFIKNKPQNLVQDASYVHTDNNFTTAEKTKLAGLENYELPQASADTLGGIKVGANLSIDWDGVLSAEDSDAIVEVDTLPSASSSTHKFYRLSTDGKVYMSISGGSAPSDSDQIDEAYFNFYDPEAFFTWDYYYKGATEVHCADGNVTLYRWWTDDTSFFSKLSATDQVVDGQFLSSFLAAMDEDLEISYNESTGIYSSTLTVAEVQSLVNTNLAANRDIVLHKLEAESSWEAVATEDEVNSKQDILVAGDNISISGNTISAVIETATTAEINALFTI